MTYNLFPLVAGHILLPKLHLAMPANLNSSVLDKMILKKLPTHIFIKVSSNCHFKKGNRSMLIINNTILTIKTGQENVQYLMVLYIIG